MDGALAKYKVAAIKKLTVRYLKARGFETPRTWISGLAEQLRRAGAEHLVNQASHSKSPCLS